MAEIATTLGEKPSTRRGVNKLAALVLLVAANCQAASTYQTYHKDMSASTTIRSETRYFVPVCAVRVNNITAGTTVKATSTVTTTNNTGLVVGVTSEVHWCNPATGLCSRRITATDSNQRDGGNVTPQEHHKVYKTYARLTAKKYLGSRVATSSLVVYSTGKAIGQRLNIDMCDLDIEVQR